MNLPAQLFICLACGSFKNNHRDKKIMRGLKRVKIDMFFEVFEKIKALNLGLGFEIKRGRKTASFTPM